MLAVITGLFLVFIVGCTALVGGAANEVSKELEKGAAKVESGSASGDSTADGADEKTAAVGDRLTLTGTTYRVTDVRTASTLGESFTRVEANGRSSSSSLS